MKRRNKKIIGISLAVLIVAGVGVMLMYFLQPAGQQSTTSAAEAIREAQNYKPPAGTICTQSLVRARHKATGAEYTFTTGCIPDGWELVSSSNTQ